jgi:hypothetical protein
LRQRKNDSRPSRKSTVSQASNSTKGCLPKSETTRRQVSDNLRFGPPVANWIGRGQVSFFLSRAWFYVNVHWNGKLTRKLAYNLRFLLYDPKTQLWYDVGDEYAREKVSHSLRSRPNEHRRIKPKIRKKMSCKPKHTPALEAVVTRLIQEQQELLKSMIDKETSR